MTLGAHPATGDFDFTPKSLGPAATVARYDWLEYWIFAVFLGNMLGGRSFAHIGVSPLYIGEVTLGACYLLRPRAIGGLWYGGLVRPGAQSALSWSLYGSMIFGIAEVARSLIDGDFHVYALQNVAFHFYPLYLFVGICLGVRHPELFSRCVRPVAWANAFYGLAYIGLLSPLGLTGDVDNPSVVGLFGQPSGAAFALLGLLATERKLARAVLPLTLNFLVLAGMQRRAEWLSIGVGVTLLATMTGKLRQLAACVLAAAAIFALALVVDLRVPSPQTRGGDISARDLVGRGLAAIDENAASEFTQNASSFAGTVDWRTAWWRNILAESHRDAFSATLGLGYAYPIWELHPEELSGDTVRTPHSIFVYVLGYTGWMGLLVFLAWQAALGRLLWRAYRKTGQPLGFCYWVLIFVWIGFDPYLEVPFEAIPTYLIWGLAAAPAVSGSQSTEPKP